MKPSSLIDHGFNFLKSKIEKSFSIQFQYLTNTNKMMKSSMFLIFCILSLILFNEVTESTILTNDRDISKYKLNSNLWPFYLLRPCVHVCIIFIFKDHISEHFVEVQITSTSIHFGHVRFKLNHI